MCYKTGLTRYVFDDCYLINPSIKSPLWQQKMISALHLRGDGNAVIATLIVLIVTV